MKDKQFINYPSFDGFKPDWDSSKPFSHIVLQDFFKREVAERVAQEFPSFDDSAWRVYDNALEVKKLCNHWDKFGPVTYRIFNLLNSEAFVNSLEVLTDCKLFPDPGLSGGGLHTHKRGGKLNVHLDYSIHPKLGLERRLNLLIYLTPNWEEDWGGGLGLWAAGTNNSPGTLDKKIRPDFNKAVLFDTTQQSWHGLPEPIKCPSNVCRNSLAVYYLCNPRENADTRGKALFSPYREQQNDPEVLELIRQRQSTDTAHLVYGDK